MEINEIVGRFPIGEDQGITHRLHKVKGDKHMVSHLYMPNRGSCMKEKG